MADFPAWPAWLFCPADRPERFAKAASAADVVILDLEDGVKPADRPRARDALIQASAQLDPERTVIRVNAVGSVDHPLDMTILADLPFGLVMLSKAESAAQLSTVSRWRVVALCETPRGVQAANDIAAAENCVGLMWGAEDLMAGLGGTSSRDARGNYRDVVRHARSETLLAAAAAGVAALDGVYLDIHDLGGLEAEAVDAVASGFVAKVCIHPSQLAVIRHAFYPTDEQIAWAHHVIDGMDRQEHGAFSLDGQMIDEPLIRQALRIAALADRS